MKIALKYIIIIICLSSCSQFSNSITSKLWHNTNAKYNLLLLARDDMKLANTTINSINQDNYNAILPVFIKIDSTKLDSSKYYLIDAVKKTSLIAERHSNSKYIDEAYLILADARLKKQEFFNAIETFKYVNAKAKTPQKKQEALIGLFRAYIENEDYITANQVADILAREDLTDNLKGKFLITKAYYHQLQNEAPLALVFLEEGLKYIQKKSDKARFYFIIGQYYDKLGNNILAKKNYRYALNNKPKYDIEFNANLGLLMNESLANNSNVLFDDMLTDRKNQDLKDKIYYKMGEMEVSKSNYPAAIKMFNNAVRFGLNDKVQKAYSYKAIGDVYIEKLNEFDLGATYYDSTLITIPKNHGDYDKLNKRAAVFNEFIRNKKIYDLEDSLQTLASLSTVELDKKVIQVIENQKIEDQKKAADLLIKSENNTVNSGKKWLFYEKDDLAKAKNEFIRIWGNRNLEDNWRRIETSSNFNKNTREVTNVIENKLISENIDAKIYAEKQKLASQIQEIKLKIPLTQVQLAVSIKKQEEAMFALGKIYKLQFNDTEKSVKTYNNFLNKFPNSSFEPEVYYFLALYSENKNDFKQKLLDKYPNSTFARQLKKGSVSFSKDREKEAQEYYAKIYKLFENNDYSAVISNLDTGLTEYLGSQSEDKMAMLRILALAKNNLKTEYIISLTDFVRSYPTSDLREKAKLMLDKVNK